MVESELFEKTARHIGEYLEQDVSHLTLDSRLDTAVPGLDSLKLFEMLLYLEDCFGIEVDKSLLDTLVTMRDLVGYIGSKLAVTS